MLKILTLIIKKLAFRIINNKKITAAKMRKQKRRNAHEEKMIALFGRRRWVLSKFLGDLALYTCNKKFFSQKPERPPEEPKEKPYRKFYSDEKILKRYAEKLKDNYNVVEIKKVFYEDQQQAGFLLFGYEKFKETEIKTNVKD